MRIEIIKTPAGEAPEEVRQGWVGVQIEARRMPRGLVEAGVSSNIPLGLGNRGGFQVETEVAISMLLQKDPRAAFWFLDNLDPRQTWLSFGPDEARVVEDDH